MRNIVIRSIRKGLPFGVSGLLILYVLLAFDMDALATSFGQISPLFILAVLLLLICNLAVVSFRLSRLLNHFGRAIEFSDAARAGISGLFSSLFIFAPVGAILGRERVLRDRGVQTSMIALITIYERLILAFVGGGLFVIGGIVLFEEGKLWEILDKIPLWQMAIAMMIATFVGFHLSRSKFEMTLIRELVSHRTARRLAEISGITLVGQIFNMSGFVIALIALDAPADLPMLFAAAAVVSFAASLPISVNGWGVREIAAIYTFGQLGLPVPEAVAVSVLIGICATFVILISTPLLLIKRKKRAPSAQVSPDSQPTLNTAVSVRSLSMKDIDASEKILALVVSFAAAILVFFQFHAPLGGGVVTLNLADPFALIGLTVLLLTWMTTKRFPVEVPKIVKIWFLAATVVILLGFLLGVWRFGIIHWALNNRLFGWLMLLGYAATGALLVGAWGRHGQRRICELILATGAAVIITSLGMEAGEDLFGLRLTIASNFDGFSANRNGFSFQLILALCCGIAMSPLRRSGLWQAVWVGLTGIVLFGIWQTQSKTGLIVASSLLLLCLIFHLGHRRTLGLSLVTALGIYAALWLASLLLDGSAGGAVVAGAGFELPNQTSLSEHWDTILNGLLMWRDNPLIGGGLGAYVNFNHLSENGEPLIIHSTAVWLMAEFGVIGFVVFAALPAYGIKLAFRRYPRLKSPRVILLICIAYSFILFGLPHDVFAQRIFWLLLGVGLASYCKRRSEE